MKLNLLTKGIILVSIPLCFEVTLFGILLHMQNEVEREAVRVSNAKKVNDIVNSITSQILMTFREVRDWRSFSKASRKVRENLALVHKDIDTLKVLLKDDPDKFERLLISERKFYKAEALMSNFENQIRHADSLDGVSELINNTRHQVNLATDGVLSSGLLKIAQDTKLEAENDKSLEMRKRIRDVLKIALGASFVFAISAAIFISKSMVLRLQRLRENAGRLAREEALLPRVGGNDEIAELDRTFHLASEMIGAAKAKEKEANEKLEEIRREVTAMVTHDLRTPLQTIITFLGMLKMGKIGDLSQRGNSLLESADKSSTRMNEIIESVLDLEKIRSGKAELSLEKLDVAGLLKTCAEALTLLGESKEITISVEAVEGTSISGDRHWLRQVIINLLANAINYSPEKTVVTLACRINGNCAEILICDQGPGIPDEEKQNIFEKFQRLKSTAKKVVGSGLGLTFCKEMVKLHNGTIYVEDNEPCGTRFVVGIPMPIKEKTEIA